MTNVRKTMRGVLLTGHGDVDKLDFRDDIPVPTPGAGEVLVRVTAAAVNNTDINTRTGWYSKSEGNDQQTGWGGAPMDFPRIQGADACGYVVAVGDGVSASRIGERVLIEPVIRESGGRELTEPWYFGSECDGAFAEYAVIPSCNAHSVDSGMTDLELASFPCSYLTAENLLTRSYVRAGERVLITGASGGVGSAAVQLAKARGADVTAITSESKANAVRELGADQTLPRDADLAEILGTDVIDVAIDLVGGPVFSQLLEVLKPGGRYAVSGAIAGAVVDLDLRTLYLKDLEMYGCTMFDEQIFPALLKRIESGEISPVVATVYPLEKIVEAQQAFISKRHVGKIVIEVGTGLGK